MQDFNWCAFFFDALLCFYSVNDRNTFSTTTCTQAEVSSVVSAPTHGQNRDPESRALVTSTDNKSAN